MHFTWLGSTAMKIQTKYAGNDVSIVIDPYKPSAGTFPRSLTPDIGLYTRGQEGSVTLSGNPFILDTPGECETKGVLIMAAAGREPGTTVLRIDAEDIGVGHLGMIGSSPDKAALDMLAGVDILCLPVGSKEAFEPQAAMKIVSIIEPRIIIPIGFKSPNDPKAGTVDGFLKEIGQASAPESKVIIKKKDLPQEETKVIVLKKE